MSRVRVKICGITCAEDALAAVEAGADALGFVFAAGRRTVSADQVLAITAALPPLVTRVGVFVNAELDEVCRLLREGVIDRAQLHGDEDAAYLRALGGRAYKALRVRPDADPWPEIVSHECEACGVVLLDAWDPRSPGGTGRAFDWRQAAGVARRLPVILAGGLRPDNVAAALRCVQPWAVDVSSGVEISPGRKDARKMEEFIDAVAR